MKKTSFTFFSIVCVLSLYSQDTVWKKIKIDENLVVALPGKISQIDTFAVRNKMKLELRIFKAETETSTIGLVVTRNETNINAVDKESLRQALDGMAKGLCNSATRQGLSCVVSDTTIDGLPCKKSKFYSTQNVFDQKINYSFLVKDKMYTFTIAAVDTNEIYRNYSNLLSSISFASTAKEYHLSSLENTSAYRWGYMFGTVLFLLLIIAVIVYFVKK